MKETIVHLILEIPLVAEAKPSLSETEYEAERQGIELRFKIKKKPAIVTDSRLNKLHPPEVLKGKMMVSVYCTPDRKQKMIRLMQNSMVDALQDLSSLYKQLSIQTMKFDWGNSFPLPANTIHCPHCGINVTNEPQTEVGMFCPVGCGDFWKSETIPGAELDQYRHDPKHNMMIKHSK